MAPTRVKNDYCHAALVQGGVIGVFINWKCNLDLDPSHCKPTYSFRRLDLRKDLPDAGYYYRLAPASNADFYTLFLKQSLKRSSAMLTCFFFLVVIIYV